MLDFFFGCNEGTPSTSLVASFSFALCHLGVVGEGMLPFVPKGATG